MQLKVSRRSHSAPDGVQSGRQPASAALVPTTARPERPGVPGTKAAGNPLSLFGQ